MNPISDSNNGHFTALGINVENNQSSGRTAYSQEFKANNGGSYTATVYSSKLNATPKEIKTLILKAIEIAENLGIGKDGLEKINITGGGDNPSIMGTYQSDGQNSSRVVDLLAHLKAQAASGSDEEKSAATIKLENLKRITACFNKSLGVVSNESSTDPDVGEGLESPEFEDPSSEQPDWGTAHFTPEKNRYTNMGLSMQEGYNVFLNQGENSVPKYINATRCSAGCGRTGTFIGVDVASQPINNQDAASLTNKMREFRSGMVQTKEQYDLIKQAFFIRNLPLIAHKNDEEPTKESIDKAESKTSQKTTEESRKITVQQLKEEGIAEAAQLYKTETISEHFDVKNIAADGDCFFASIANQLPRDSLLDMLGVRKAIADHMQEKLEDYQNTGIDLEYIENLKLSSKGKDRSGWGGDVEAKAFSEIYNCPVIIYRHNGKRQEFIPAGASYKSPIFLLFNGTNHYDALTLKS